VAFQTSGEEGGFISPQLQRSAQHPPSIIDKRIPLEILWLGELPVMHTFTYDDRYRKLHMSARGRNVINMDAQAYEL